MPDVFVGVGANLDPGKNIRKALRLLQQDFNNICCSPVYQNTAVGFDGPPFINLVVQFDSSAGADEVHNMLKRIEYQCGRIEGAERFASRTMDLDLLLYGDRILHGNGVHVPREDILQHAYVLKPLADLYPQGVHPLQGQRYIDLWRVMEKNRKPVLLAVQLLEIA